MRKANQQTWTPRILLGLFAALIILSFWTAHPFLPAVLVAAFLVAVLQRPHQWLLKKLKDRKKTTAALATAGVTVALLLPFTLFAWSLASEVPTAVDGVRDWLGPQGFASLPQKVPARLRPIVQSLIKPPGQPPGQRPTPAATNEQVSKAVGSAAPVAGALLMRVFDYLMLTLVLVLSLFYLFLDGRSFVAYVLWLLPFKASYGRELLSEFWRVAYAMIWGTAAIALGQGICGCIIFAVLGVPAPLLLALAMAFASFIPAVGTTLVWVPVAVALGLSGHAGKAAILSAYCVVVIVIFVDHLLRPLVVKDKMTMHPLVAFVAMFGGVIAFGLIGLLLGPLIASALVTVLRIYGRDLGPHAEHEDGDVPDHELPPQESAGGLPALAKQQH